MIITSNKVEILNRLLQSYEMYFDIKKCEEKEIPLAAKCEFHMHNEKYVLIKKAQLWQADANEYVYIFKLDSLTKELFLKCKNYAYKEGMNAIHPKPGHMYSYITSIFICDSCEKEVEKMIKKCKILKNFKLSIYGWMDYRISCINIENNNIYGNKSGKDTTKFLKNLLMKKSSLIKKENNEFC